MSGDRSCWILQNRIGIICKFNLKSIISILFLWLNSSSVLRNILSTLTIDCRNYVVDCMNLIFVAKLENWSFWILEPGKVVIKFMKVKEHNWLKWLSRIGMNINLEIVSRSNHSRKVKKSNRKSRLVIFMNEKSKHHQLMFLKP